ncbi:ABC-three component system middle component 6 [Paraglaciecola arctica]|nr:ABC-three component system middle component 6 [Paraglaciecola arctica]
MILPNKYLREDEALIGVGGKILMLLQQDMLLSELWEETKEKENIGNFERFVLALDLLYLLGLIIFEENKIKRVKE